MIYLLYLQLVCICIANRRIIPDVKFPISNAHLFFTIDPRKNNDDVLMKKIVVDNEKIQLLDKLYSTVTSTSKKLELIQQSECDSYPSNLRLKDLFNDWE